jgi:anti-anti-sigma factor
MTAAVSNRIADNRATLSLAGRFDFSIHRDFRRNYEEILGTPGIRQLDVDLAKVEYIDSSALGMLLLLREKAGGQNIQLKLANAQGSVRQVLEVANFGRLFEIS